MKPRKIIPLVDCDRPDGRGLAERFPKAASVREAWIRDLFRLRGDFSHGRIQARYPSLWHQREHLLLGGFLFPLLLKLTLVSRGIYELNDSDREGIQAFEALCCADHFRETGGDASKFPWTKIVRQAGFDAIIRQLLEENPEGPWESG